MDTSIRSMLSFKELVEYRVRMILRDMIPAGMRRKLKKPLKKLGLRFASDE